MYCRQPPADGLHHRDRDTVARLFVYLVVRLDGQHLVDLFILPTLKTQTFSRSKTADALAVKYA